MRLLEIHQDGHFSLTKFAPHAIPPYAILSHTWETDDQELTFQDMIEGTGRSKAGYKKIQFCGDQAKKDRLQYFWVDSCCIDKTNSTELSEAINSMFKWYQNAVKCYVYLSDISSSDVISSAPSQLPHNSPFRHSKWFTRGWTLQELLAPSSVEFFSKESNYLGNKTTLEQHICDITGLPVEALHGTPMSHFSLDERISWASKRKTTIEEDQAYCLLGIFDCHMPLIYGEGRKNAIRRLREVAKFTSTHEPFSTVPFAPDPDFVDRPDILAWIRDKCGRPGARAALVGLGGVGKSQLAIQYSHDIRDASPQTFVLWVHASTKARFEQGYRDIAARLELPGRDDPKVNVLQLVSNWLCDEANGKWTMILDNVDDAETFLPLQRSERDKPPGNPSTSLAAYLPQSRNGSILITSRNKDAATRLAGGYRNIKEVRAMDESQGLQLLQNKLQDGSIEGAVDLLCTLDYIPLAITQAAAYINRRARMTISGYLNEFHANDQKRENLLNRDAGDLRRDESASNSVVTTWQLSFERIRQERRSAADLLLLMSFFNQQGIPESILRKHSRTGARSSREEEVNSAFDEDLDTLQAYSLISVTAETDMCEMHSLVRFCTQVWLSSSSDPERWKKRFVRLMAQEFPYGEFENWTKCKLLLPHIESLYDMKFSDRNSVERWVSVLLSAARYMETALAKYDNAEMLIRRALEWCEKELGEQSLFTLGSMASLASVLWHRGEYGEAEMVERRALQGKEKALGEEHMDTLASANNLALTLKYQGKYDEAEKLNRRVMELSEKGLGRQHVLTLVTVDNLATVLADQGKYNKAEQLYRRALQGRVKQLGEEHPSTLSSENNLATVLRDQHKYDEAEKLLCRVLNVRGKTLGKDHPDTLGSAYNLAFLLHRQKRYLEASEHYQRAYDGYMRKLGSQHPRTISCLGHFTAMQQEAEGGRVGRNGTLDNNDKAEARGPPTQGVTTQNGRKAMPKPASRSSKSKMGSWFTHLKGKIGRKES